MKLLINKLAIHAAHPTIECARVRAARGGKHACALVMRPRLNDVAKTALRTPGKANDPDANLIRENRETAAFARVLLSMTPEEIEEMNRRVFERQLQAMLLKPAPAEAGI